MQLSSKNVAGLSTTTVVLLLCLLNSKVKAENNDDSGDQPPPPHIKLTDLFDLKDRAVDRLCQTTTNLLRNILVNCNGGKAAEEKYCSLLRDTVESLPAGCSLASESFNESVRKLAYCFRHHDQSCVDGLLEDLRSKVDQLGEAADLAVDKMKKL